ncbi:MAG: hypothetical protein HKO03_11800 [Acidimicrobiia bacterium]|nr:hypothetical protein [Acidimicrobiia bacterium]
MSVEEQLTKAFRIADLYEPSSDLFAKVQRSIEEDAAHRLRARRIAAAVVASLSFIAVYLYIAIDRVDDSFEMPFWTLEVLATGVMIGIVLVLGPTIRRFGTSFESDVFRSNPATGRSFLTLMDIAYYLIFGAFTFMTLQYSPPAFVAGTENLARWIEFEIRRIGGLLLLMGVLHAVTLVVLPAMGLVFSANLRRARRALLGDAAPPADPRNDQIDRWITIVIWVIVGLVLLNLMVSLLLAVVGLAG